MKILAQQVQVGFIARSVGEVNVDITGGLFQRVIILLVHRESADGVVPSKDEGRAIAVVNVQVHRHRTPDGSIQLEFADGNGDVVDHAKPFAMSGKSMVK